MRMYPRGLARGWPPLTLLVLLALTACGGGAATPATGATPGGALSTAAPEDVRVPDSAVTQRLNELAAAAGTITGNDAGSAADRAAAARLEPAWAAIEGTVKATEPAIYDRIEAALNPLKADATASGGDASTRAQREARDLQSAIRDYLSKHP